MLILIVVFILFCFHDLFLHAKTAKVIITDSHLTLKCLCYEQATFYTIRNIRQITRWARYSWRWLAFWLQQIVKVKQVSSNSLTVVWNATTVRVFVLICRFSVGSLKNSDTVKFEIIICLFSQSWVQSILFTQIPCQ